MKKQSIRTSLIDCFFIAITQVNPENVAIAPDEWAVPYIFAKTAPEGALWVNLELGP